MKTSIPEIRIKDAWLLRQNASVPLNELWGNGEPLLSDESYRKIVKSYQKAWKPNEYKIVSSMTKTFDLSFRQNIIDVYIAPWFHAFSDPLIIGVTKEPDIFIDFLTHELLHRLFTDNTLIPDDYNLTYEWQNLFGKTHSPITLIHIPVHAALKAIYLDTLNAPERLKRDISMNKKYDATDYVAAWKYVEQHGYLEIIDKLKASYKRLSKEITS